MPFNAIQELIQHKLRILAKKSRDHQDCLVPTLRIWFTFSHLGDFSGAKNTTIHYIYIYIYAHLTLIEAYYKSSLVTSFVVSLSLVESIL